MSKKLQSSFYVILEMGGRYHYDRKIKAVKVLNRTNDRPACEVNQVPLLVTVELPVALFQRPELSIKIAVEDIPQLEIDADMQAVLAERMQEILGVNANITVEIPDDG